tara:strand:+ start:553 stop:1614 length:1062 start_codon:yes stop_codon:yes gene_type:complete
MILFKKILFICITSIMIANNGNGTTTANFLEIDVGSRATSMGGAYVSLSSGPSAIFWNPSGLTGVDKTEALFMYQPYWDDSNIIFTGIATPIDNSSYFGAALFMFNWGEIEETTLEYQDGTGVMFSPNEYSISLSYARKFVDWFSFGSSVKYISSNLDVGQISGSALAMDLGVMIETDFFSSRNTKDGLKIGMSISNYGTKLKYDEGIGLLVSTDISEDNGNWSNLLTEVHTEGDELPLNFRIGCSLTPINTLRQKLTLAIDGVHPNNNSESINLGLEYMFIIPGKASFHVNSGFKGLFMSNPDNQYSREYGPAFGFGMEFWKNNNPYISIDYCYQSFWTMSNTNMFSIGLYL